MFTPRLRRQASQQGNTSDILLIKCREYFSDMDLDGDGRLCRKEFLKMIEVIGMELDVSELRKAYDTADQDKDGDD